MKNLVIFTVLFPILLFSLYPVKAQQPEEIKETVTKINRQLFDALIDGDAEKIASLYTENGTLFPPSGKIVKGQKAIQSYWKTSIEGSKTLRVETENIDFELYGSTAYESGTYSLTYRLPGEQDTQTAEGIYLIIWKKRGDTWKLHIDMWN